MPKGKEDAVVEDEVGVALDVIDPALVLDSYSNWAAEAEEQRQVTVAELKRNFPPEAIKQRKGANNMTLDYVSGETVIRRIMKATNDNFDVTFAFPPILQTMTENYKDRTDGKTKQRDVLIAIVGVEMEIPGLGKRAGIGVQKVAAASEDLFKGALTDAIKNSGKNHGVALHLYGENVEGDNAPNF